MKTLPTTVRLSPETRQQLAEAARRRGSTITAVIYRAIEAYLGSDGGKTADVARARNVLRRRARPSSM